MHHRCMPTRKFHTSQLQRAVSGALKITVNKLRFLDIKLHTLTRMVPKNKLHTRVAGKLRIYTAF